MHIERTAWHAAGAALIAALTIAADPAFPQTFSKITTPGNPIVAMGGGATGYGGASWIDADDDGDVDLFINRVGLFRNDGGSVFVHVAGPLALGNQGDTFGNTWADVDNDGDLDVFLSGGDTVGSSLYLNGGDLAFTRVASGPIGAWMENLAWGCAFADYDADGHVDVVTAAAYQFAGILNPNRLFHGLGDGTFERIDDTPITQDLAPFTIPTWSDYDLDGDPDLFIGTGPANGTVALDYLFRNLRETTPGAFERLTTPPLGTDLQDGQVYNWIDYDNDGDLDVFLTNYIGTTSGMPNRLYRNMGGTFVMQTVVTAGAIASDAQPSLASVWQDFDNDGDLDCVVTNDGAVATRYYRNNGNLGFTALTLTGLTTAGPHWGAAGGDYDDDGHMDLFVAGPPANFGLIRNTTSNANHWLKVRLIGTLSNRAAIGARVRVLATIGGAPVWQLREISAQNSFNGMNALEAHFGLGAATVADSVVVEWPSGQRTVETGVPADTRRAIVESSTIDVPPPIATSLGFGIAAVSPNPGRGPFTVRLALPSPEPASLDLIDVGGRRLATAAVAGAGAQTVRLAVPGSLPSGVYFLRLAQGPRHDARRVVVIP